MKLRQQQITRAEQILNDLERKLEEMEQQDYITFDLEKDLRNLQSMLDDLREEIENEQKI
jgi:predicted RNase H-like nuclease (RuvC/YqgF family)